MISLYNNKLAQVGGLSEQRGGLGEKETSSTKMVVRDRLKEMQTASPHCTPGEDVEIEMKPLKGKDKVGADGMAAFLLVAEEINGKVDEVKKNVEDMRKTQRLILSEPSRAERDK